MYEFNLNHKIYFELTEKGKRRLSDPYFKASVHDAGNGLYETQMWTFCNLFGPGMDVPSCDTEVKTGVFFREEDVKCDKCSGQIEEIKLGDYVQVTAKGDPDNGKIFQVADIVNGIDGPGCFNRDKSWWYSFSAVRKLSQEELTKLLNPKDDQEFYRRLHNRFAEIEKHLDSHHQTLEALQFRNFCYDGLAAKIDENETRLEQLETVQKAQIDSKSGETYKIWGSSINRRLEQLGGIFERLEKLEANQKAQGFSGGFLDQGGQYVKLDAERKEALELAIDCLTIPYSSSERKRYKEILEKMLEEAA